jgi:hypothetical protein
MFPKSKLFIYAGTIFRQNFSIDLSGLCAGSCNLFMFKVILILIQHLFSQQLVINIFYPADLFLVITREVEQK